MMNNENTINLRFFSSDKLILITTNKVASRYVSLFFQNSNSNNYGTIINVNTDFSIDLIKTDARHSDYYTIGSDESIQRTYKEWDDIINNKNKKDILFLYRNPYERTISGIIQEFMSDIEPFKNTFILKSYIEELYDKGNNLFNKFKESSIFNQSVILESDVSDLYKNLLCNYIEFESSNLINKYHVKPYIIYLYDFIKNSNIDMNKLYLIDVDDSKINLKDVLIKYELNTSSNFDDSTNRASNVILKDILKNILTDNKLIKSNLNLSKSLSFINTIIDIENSFFKKMKTIPQNITK